MDLYSRVRDAQEALYEAQMGYDAYARANHEGVTDELLKLDHAWLEIMGLEVGRACLWIEDDSKRLWFASKRPDPAQLARQLSDVVSDSLDPHAGKVVAAAVELMIARGELG